MTYRVRCPACGSEFKASHPPDLWRAFRLLFGLSREQVWRVQRFALAGVVLLYERGEPPLSRAAAVDELMRFAEAVRDEEASGGG